MTEQEHIDTNRHKFYLYDEFNEHPANTLVADLSEMPVRIRFTDDANDVHYLSTWLAMHDDTSAFDFPQGLQRITPVFVGCKELVPVVLHQNHGIWKIIELKTNESFELDILEKHALVPKELALSFLSGSCNEAKIEDWVDAQWSTHPYNPVIAWRVVELPR